MGGIRQLFRDFQMTLYVLIAINRKSEDQKVPPIWGQIGRLGSRGQ